MLIEYILNPEIVGRISHLNFLNECNDKRFRANISNSQRAWTSS